MKTLRNLLFALIALMSIVASPMLVAADSGKQEALCATLEECQTMVSQYAEMYGPLPIPTPVSESAISPDIEMTGGEAPPQDVVNQIHVYEGNLHQIALTFCTDPYWTESVYADIYFSGIAPEDSVNDQSTFKALGWQPEYNTYQAYLLEQAKDFSVPSRPPTLWELVQQYPGCETGEYEAPEGK